LFFVKRGTLGTSVKKGTLLFPIWVSIPLEEVRGENFYVGKKTYNTNQINPLFTEQ